MQTTLISQSFLHPRAPFFVFWWNPPILTQKNIWSWTCTSNVWAIPYTTGLSLRKAVVIHSQLIFTSRAAASCWNQPGGRRKAEVGWEQASWKGNYWVSMADQDSHGLSGLVPGVWSSSHLIHPFGLNSNKASVTRSSHRPDPWRQPLPSWLPPIHLLLGHSQPWQGPQSSWYGACPSWQNPGSGEQYHT